MKAAIYQPYSTQVKNRHRLPQVGEEDNRVHGVSPLPLFDGAGRGSYNTEGSRAVRERTEAPVEYRVTLVQSEEGFAVSCPALRGCHSQGATREEALANIREAIREWLDGEKADKTMFAVCEESDLNS